MAMEERTERPEDIVIPRFDIHAPDAAEQFERSYVAMQRRDTPLGRGNTALRIVKQAAS